jgi:3-dehydroquinate synthase
MKSSRAEILRQSIDVRFAYPVVFTRGVFEPANPVLAEVLAQREPSGRHRVLAVLDAGFAAAHPGVGDRVRAYFAAHASRLEPLVDLVEIPGGEAAKNDVSVVDGLHALFHRHRLDRHAYVLIVGGGAVLDAAGYAAATTHRGLRVVRVPTTVLSQDDSGVGVKNGINAFGIKNFLGTFVAPDAVLCDADFLIRLPRRDAVAGIAEAVKVALVRDAAFFDWIETNAAALAAQDLDALTRLIRWSAELHLDHIATGGDPFERGSARPLDFGHWSAHKLESLSEHDVRHGEAVGMGMLLDSRYAVQIGLLSEPDFVRIHRLLRALGLPLWHDALAAAGPRGAPAVLEGLDDFREHLGGEHTITLVRGPGSAVEVNEMDRAAISRALDWMRDSAAGAERPAR